jgi:hypothetical protein
VVLTPGQRKAVFVLVVIVLAAVGYFLVVPGLDHSRAQSHAGASQPAPSAPAPQPTQSTQPAQPAATTTSGGVDIYSWLPFTRQDLAAAASVAVRFSVDYNTYSYTESARDYVTRMGDLITGQLATTLRAAYSVPGVAKLRTDQRQVSTGTAAIHALRAFGPSSITFRVDTQQHLVTSQGASDAGASYAVTVTGSGTNWQVSDIEPWGAGNS